MYHVLCCGHHIFSIRLTVPVTRSHLFLRFIYPYTHTHSHSSYFACMLQSPKRSNCASLPSFLPSSILFDHLSHGTFLMEYNLVYTNISPLGVHNGLNNWRLGMDNARVSVTRKPTIRLRMLGRTARMRQHRIPM